jgi:hypothetical protein
MDNRALNYLRQNFSRTWLNWLFALLVFLGSFSAGRVYASSTFFITNTNIGNGVGHTAEEACADVAGSEGLSLGKCRTPGGKYSIISYTCPYKYPSDFGFVGRDDICPCPKPGTIKKLSGETLEDVGSVCGAKSSSFSTSNGSNCAVELATNPLKIYSSYSAGTTVFNGVEYQICKYTADYAFTGHTITPSGSDPGLSPPSTDGSGGGNDGINIGGDGTGNTGQGDGGDPSGDGSTGDSGTSDNGTGTTGTGSGSGTNTGGNNTGGGSTSGSGNGAGNSEGGTGVPTGDGDGDTGTGDSGTGDTGTGDTDTTDPSDTGGDSGTGTGDTDAGGTDVGSGTGTGDTDTVDGNTDPDAPDDTEPDPIQPDPTPDPDPDTSGPNGSETGDGSGDSGSDNSNGSGTGDNGSSSGNGSGSGSGTGAGSGDGDGTGEGDCDPETEECGECNPATEDCGEVSGTASCDAEPECDGDVLQCERILQEWRMFCAWSPANVNSALDNSAVFQEFNKDAGTEEDGSLSFLNPDVVDVQSELGLSNILADRGNSGSCPSPYTLNFQIGTQQFDYDPICQTMTSIRPLVLAAAGLISFFMAFRALA